MGFMGIDLVEPVDNGNFLHYGEHMSLGDTRATLHEPCVFATRINGVGRINRCAGQHS